MDVPCAIPNIIDPDEMDEIFKLLAEPFSKRRLVVDVLIVLRLDPAAVTKVPCSKRKLVVDALMVLKFEPSAYTNVP